MQIATPLDLHFAFFAEIRFLVANSKIRHRLTKRARHLLIFGRVVVTHW